MILNKFPILTIDPILDNLEFCTNQFELHRLRNQFQFHEHKFLIVLFDLDHMSSNKMTTQAIWPKMDILPAYNLYVRHYHQRNHHRINILAHVLNDLHHKWHCTRSSLSNLTRSNMGQGQDKFFVQTNRQVDIFVSLGNLCFAFA